MSTHNQLSIPPTSNRGQLQATHVLLMKYSPFLFVVPGAWIDRVYLYQYLHAPNNPLTL